VSNALTYAASGVDIAAGEDAVQRIKAAVASTARPEVIGGIGGFGGLFAFPVERYRQPVLVSTTDGVGTKSYIASAVGKFSTIGVDLVAMCVDDLVCTGAEPLFMLDYLALARLDPAVVEEIVSGIADGCRQAGCALIGGEMAEHPQPQGEPGRHIEVASATRAGEHAFAFDLAGFAVGVVERSAILSPELIRPGDELVGIASPNLRSNGFSLARRALLEAAGRSLDAPAWEGADHSLGDELLAPSVIYAPAVLSLASQVELHGLAHITGGGIAGNLARILPDDVGALVERHAWRVPRIFHEIAACGKVAPEEMERVFNMGLGMIAAVGAGSGRKAVDVLCSLGHESWVVGRVDGNVKGVNIV
jgi:phosphoribosylformylglycinamidine cyclo-ligase